MVKKKNEQEEQVCEGFGSYLDKAIGEQSGILFILFDVNSVQKMLWSQI